VLLEDALRLVTLSSEAADRGTKQRARGYLARRIVENAPELADIAATVCHFVEHGQPRLV
jgi:hypothetical protein